MQRTPSAPSSVQLIQPSTRKLRLRILHILPHAASLPSLCRAPIEIPTSLGHQAKESSCSFGTLVLIGVAAVCAVLTPFSARGLHAAG